MFCLNDLHEENMFTIKIEDRKASVYIYLWMIILVNLSLDFWKVLGKFSKKLGIFNLRTFNGKCTETTTTTQLSFW